MAHEGFLMDLHTAELFYRTCKRFKIAALPERVALMRELTRRKKAKYVRDVAEATAGKNVLRITQRGNNEK